MADNQHNDPLEQFFRKKAEEYDIQYKEEDWLKLEDRLDTLDEQRKDRKWRRLVAAAVIILFSLLAYFTYQQQQKINQLNERLSNAENVTDQPKSISPDNADEPTNEKGQQQQLASENDNNLTDRTEDPLAVSGESPSKQKDSKPESSKKTFASGIQENIPLAQITENYLVTTSAKSSPGVDGRFPAISAIQPPKFNTNTSSVEKPQTNTSITSAQKNSIALRSSPRFSVGILAGPDMSTVGGISNFYNPGHKFGLTFEYNINRNFAVSVGALRSKVRYTASGNEYQPPTSYGSYGTVLDETIGECILIDIPISIKYNFLHFSESRIYATAGLSSYIMLDEEYRFNYENNQPGLQQRWHERTGTRHWMSNATVSIGYELDVMRNLSIRAEPFLKIPLQEVGWGNVKLYSVGSFVSLNYNIY